MAKTYDSKCYDLAEHFLQDHPHLDTTKHAHRLAAAIQDAIEGYLEYEMANYEPTETGDAWSGGFADNH